VPLQAVRAALRAKVAYLEEDRFLAPEIATASSLLPDLPGLVAPVVLPSIA
jgi:histidine ammonia-lyase